MDRERTAEAREHPRHPVERVDAHAEKRAVAGLDELGERGGQPTRRLMDGEVERHLDLDAPRHAREGAADVLDRVEPVRRRECRASDDPRRAHAVDPERPEVLTQVVVRGEVPAPGVDDEAVRAQLAPRPLAAVRAVAGPHPPAAPHRVGEQEHRVSRDRRSRPLRAREAERRLERLDPPAK
jgi:hypothetical protein